VRRGGSSSDEVRVGVAMHNEADVGREAAGAARVASVGVLYAVASPVTAQLRTLRTNSQPIYSL